MEKAVNTKKWKSVAIRTDIVKMTDKIAIRIEIVELARRIGEATERPTSNVFAQAIKEMAQREKIK